VTRRIALAILVTTWAVLLVSALATYLITRQTLLAELDQSLLSRAAALPQVLGVTPPSGAPVVPPEDRYVVRNDVGQIVARPELAARPDARPEVLGKGFVTLGDGTRLRSITVRMPGRAGGRDTAYTVVYSAPAERFDRLLRRVSWVLLAVCLGGGLATALVAVRTSRAALRPLKDTAAVVATIDEKSLDQRIDAQALPPELRPVAERLNEMLVRLEGGFAQRKRFLADAAHELRTPIAAVLTGLEVALTRPRDAAYLTQVLRDCLGDIRLLKDLAEALLNQARAEVGTDGPEVERISLTEFAEECCRLLRPLAEQKDVLLACSAPPDQDAEVPPHRLRSVVLNLLGNAIDHTPAGGRVELIATCSPGMLELSVIDTGIGIAPEHLPHVFEPFYRGNDPRTSGSGHLGLGLFLVRTHAEAMGGTCAVESQPGRGSRFTVAIPQPEPCKIKPQASQTLRENVTA
jgi:two-component system, OmpR family, heavy metal sensor histidine kinase CusS